MLPDGNHGQKDSRIYPLSQVDRKTQGPCSPIWHILVPPVSTLLSRQYLISIERSHKEPLSSTMRSRKVRQSYHNHRFVSKPQVRHRKVCGIVPQLEWTGRFKTTGEKVGRRVRISTTSTHYWGPPPAQGAYTAFVCENTAYQNTFRVVRLRDSV